MGNSIRLSPKHGVNPSLEICVYCGGEKGIALLGKIRGRGNDDIEAPSKIILDKEPCDECKEGMSQGITVFEANKALAQEHNGDPRTGKLVVMKEDKFISWMKSVGMEEETLNNILKNRAMFMEVKDFEEVFSNLS